MNETVVPTTESVTETPAVEAPADFREYNRWRDQGGQPFEEEKPPAAAEETPPAKTEPQSGAATTESQETEEEPEVEASRGRGGSRQRKIDRLTRENEAVKLQLAAVQQQLAQMQPRPIEAPPPPKPAEVPGKPKLQDFPTLEAYQEALTDWKIDQREAQKKQQAEADAARSAAEKIQTAWTESEQAARAAHTDYDEVLQSVKAPVGPGVMAATEALREDEAGPEILYYLAMHPDELSRIAALQPLSAVKEIGKLSASLHHSAPVNGNPQRKIERAPKPPPPMTRPTGETTRDSVYDEDVARDWKRWNRARSAQLKG
jgi:hypothetical protein